MAVSTFGRVLLWVHDQLSQVETNMCTNSSSKSTSSNVSDACFAIKALIEEDSTLRNEYSKIAVSEYTALVDVIQSQNIPITPSLEDLASKIRQG